jgi:acyl-ACP thioesterase
VSDVSETTLTEIVDPPGTGRVFTQRMRPGLADCAPSGRIRLDGLARWLQEIAYSDVEDAGLAFHAVWVVRRTRMRIARFPRFAERFALETFCSGLGRMWAERRTRIVRTDTDGTADGGTPVADVEAVSLWVHLDPATWRPTPFTDEELAIYSDTLPDRRVTARLRHPAPGDAAELARIRFRASECDVAGHVNNAAFWQALEEELLADETARADVAPAGLDAIDAELEFRTPAQPGEKLILARHDRRWIVATDGEVHASAQLKRAGS